MTHLLSSLDIVHWMSLGIGAVVLGLLALVVGPLLSRSLANHLSLVLLATLGLLAGVAYFLNESHAAVPLGAYFALWAVGTVLRTESFRSASHVGLRWLGHSRLQAALLLALAPASVGMVVYSEQVEAARFAALDLHSEKPLDLAEAAGHAYTDQGTPVGIFFVREPTSPRTSQREQAFLQGSDIRERVIRTGPTSIETNCHGWVFTAGQHWIRGESVEQILADNGYQEVSQPSADDIAIYRDGQGVVLHTALVRMVAPDGTIMLESKWGQFGRFMHRPQDQTYAPAPTYYRSPRDGHVLRGLDKDYKSGPVPAQAG